MHPPSVGDALTPQVFQAQSMLGQSGLVAIPWDLSLHQGLKSNFSWTWLAP